MKVLLVVLLMGVASGLSFGMGDAVDRLAFLAQRPTAWDRHIGRFARHLRKELAGVRCANTRQRTVGAACKSEGGAERKVQRDGGRSGAGH